LIRLVDPRVGPDTGGCEGTWLTKPAVQAG